MPLATGAKVLSHCIPCGLSIYEIGALKKHRQTKTHIVTCIRDGFYCFPCKAAFVNHAEHANHCSDTHDPNRPGVVICPDCGVGFSSEKLRKTHRQHYATPHGSTCSTNPPPLAPGPKVLAHCVPCGLSIYENNGLKRHRKAETHISTCIRDGFYCLACKAAFISKPESDVHFYQVHSQSLFACVDCGVCSSSVGLQGQHLREHANANRPSFTLNIPPPTLAPAAPAPAPERKLFSRCEPCGVSIYEAGGLRKHKKTKAHIDKFMEIGLYCIPCRKVLATEASMENHYSTFHDPARTTEFGCLDCGLSFSSNAILKRHLRGHVLKPEVFSCEPCGKEYKKRSELNKHLQSPSHLRLKCFGGSACDRTFATPSAMIMHLESGACKSKIDRKGIDQLLLQHDTTNIITITGAPAAVQQLPVELPRLIPTHHAIVEMLSDSDSDSEAGVILTPGSSRSPRVSSHHYSNSNSEDGGPHTPTSLNSHLFRRGSMRSDMDGDITMDEAHTPLSGTGFSEVEFGNGLMALLICPTCRKKFSSPTGLQMHISSPVHASRIYHCPLSFLELGVKGKERNFKTLSSLVQHLEHGSCEGGVETFKKAMEFVQGRMITLGLGNMQLLEYVQPSSL